ncbi:polyhydroxyalkanoate synthesis repressor PhaR [Altererythrobacter sp. CAU 1778]
MSKNGDTIIIKKYANRRLYNTDTSSYITLDDIARMVREDVDFQVIDAKSGDDITHSILTQIIMDEENGDGEHMLPVSFLRDLIAMYGNSMQSLMPHYLKASMENFRANQAKMRGMMESSLGPNALAKIAETNMAMFQAAASAFLPGVAKQSEPAAEAKPGDDIAALRDQMAQMQKKLDELTK